jgi:hypothetical protein
MKIDAIPNNSVGPILEDIAVGSNGQCFVRFGPNGYFQTYEGAPANTYRDISPYQLNVWYRVYMEFDDSAQPDKYRVKINDDPWTPWRMVNVATYSKIDKFRIRDLATNAHAFYLDLIDGTGNWISTEDFDSYTATEDLDTKNGGSNWTGAWSKDSTGTMTVEYLEDADSWVGVGVTDVAIVSQTHRRSIGDIVGLSTQWSDDFNRGDSDPAGGDWVTSPSHGNVAIESNQLRGSVEAAPGGGAYYNKTFDSNQYSQAKVAVMQNVGVCVRMDDTVQSYYRFQVVSTVLATLGKYVSGTWTQIGADITGTYAANDVIRLEVSGNKLTCFQNGTIIRVDFDGSLTGGYPGVRFYNVAGARLDDWEGGSLGLTDTLAKKGTYARPIADTEGITDEATRIATFVRLLADALGVTDEVAFRKILVSIIADTLGVSDAVVYDWQVGGITWERYPSDTVGLTDELIQAATRARILAENLGITDEATRVGIFNRIVSDNVDVTDDAQRSIAIVRSLAENLGITDAITYNQILLVSRLIYDNVGVTDDAQRTFNAARLIADDVQISDFYASYKQMVRLLDESLEVTDYADRIAKAIRILSDDAGISDAVAYNLITALTVRIISDSVGITDEITRKIVKVRAIAESLGVTDSITIIKGLVRSIAENMEISDFPALQKNIVRLVSDTEGVTDSMERKAFYNRIIADDEGITDAASYSVLAVITRVIADDVGVSDSAARTFQAVRAIADDMGVSDFLETYKQIVRSIGENVGVSDDAERVLLALREIADDLGITDYVDASKPTVKAIQLAESMGLIDSLVARILVIAYFTIALGISKSFITVTIAPSFITLEVGE